MKNRVILLIAIAILMISYGETENEQCGSCDWETDFHCGKERVSGCMVTGLNKCMLGIISCIRETRGMKPLSEIVKGRCPKGNYSVCTPHSSVGK